MKLPPFFEEDRLAVDAALERLLPAEGTRPASIHQAMRYSVFAGGKRVRPILCLETARILTTMISAGESPRVTRSLARPSPFSRAMRCSRWRSKRSAQRPLPHRDLSRW